MGRKKIAIQPITVERNRSITFLKRRAGLFKKAYELGTLCSVDVCVIIFEHRANNQVRLFQYGSKEADIQRIIDKRQNFPGDIDTKTASHFGGDADECEDSDDMLVESPRPTKTRKRSEPSNLGNNHGGQIHSVPQPPALLPQISIAPSQLSDDNERPHKRQKHTFSEAEFESESEEDEPPSAAISPQSQSREPRRHDTDLGNEVQELALKTPASWSSLPLNVVTLESERDQREYMHRQLATRPGHGSYLPHRRTSLTTPRNHLSHSMTRYPMRHHPSISALPTMKGGIDVIWPSHTSLTLGQRQADSKTEEWFAKLSGDGARSARRKDASQHTYG